MSLQGRTCSIGELLRSGRFEPARVQRGYRWQHTHQMQLLQDLELELVRAGLDPEPIMAAAPPVAAEEQLEGLEFDDILVPVPPVPAYHLDRSNVRSRARGPATYFLGHMVVGRTRAEDLYDVYDGQQRLTTIVLLLSVIRDVAPDGPIRAAVRECLLLPDGQPRLRAPTPGGTLRRITRVDRGTEVRRQANDGEADVLLRKGTKNFRAHLERWSPARIEVLLEFLLNRVHVTVTTVADRWLAETAYMTVNTRGLHLDVTEVIKGHLVRVVSDVSRTRGQTVTDAWNRLRMKADRHFEDLLRTVAFMLFGSARTDHFASDLMDQFPDGDEGADKAEAWVLDDLPRAWACYRPLAPPRGRGGSLRGAALELRQLGFLRWFEWRAVALWFLERYDDEELDLKLRLLKRVCFTMELLGWGHKPARRARVLSKALDELRDGLSPFRKSPQGRATKPGSLHFFRDKRKQARGALFVSMQSFERYRPIARLAEVVLWLEAGERPPASVGDGNVEHVLPVASRKQWHTAFPIDSERERLKGCLGNLCMLPASMNERLGAGSYADKRERYLTLSPRWRSAHDVAAREDWTPDVIRSRTKVLATLVADHLRL